MSIQILHKNDIPESGFAGIREHRLIVDPKVFGNNVSDAWPGIGNFVYLADAKFIPNGESHLHPHKELDVISLIVDGRVYHEGSLQEGNTLESNQVQVQRAGGEGFQHNEVNPDNKENRMLQMWVSPENPGEKASYKSYSLQQGKVTRVYGGDKNQDETFASKTILDIGLINANQKISFDGEFIAYVTRGDGILNDHTVTDGHLIRGNNLTYEAKTNSQIVIVRNCDK